MSNYWNQQKLLEGVLDERMLGQHHFWRQRGIVTPDIQIMNLSQRNFLAGGDQCTASTLGTLWSSRSLLQALGQVDGESLWKGDGPTGTIPTRIG